MIDRFWQGARVGALLGLGMSLASLAVSTIVLSVGLRFALAPVNAVMLGFAAWTLFISTILGGVVAAFGRRVFEPRPGLLLHVLPLPFAALALADGAYPLAQLGTVALGHLMAALLGRALRRWPRFVSASLALGGAALALRAMGPAAAPELTESTGFRAPNVLWVVLDTGRADHLSGDLGQRTAPNLSALAEQGVVFERAYTPAVWTLPAHASMFTGLYPNHHGCMDEHLWLDAGPTTVAEALGAAGYRTGLFSSNPWVGNDTGLDRGFDLTVAAWQRSAGLTWFPAALLLRPWLSRDKGGDFAIARLKDWLNVPTERPFFALVNLLEAHAPYHEIDPFDRSIFVADATLDAAIRASARYGRFVFGEGSAPTAGEREALVALYDAGLHADDRHLGELLDTLRDRGDNTLVIVTSDHGESFGEGGRWEHHILPGEEVLHVPLVLWWPGRLPAGQRIPDTVSLVDLMPTALDLLGLAGVSGVDGTSLMPLIRGEDVMERPVFALGSPAASPVQARRYAALGLDPESWRFSSVQLGELRLVREPAVERLYDVAVDPERWIEGSSERAALSALLDGFEEEVPSAAAPEMDAATRARLRGLGYLD